MTDLRGTEKQEVETSDTSKIFAAVIVLAMIGAVGAYYYETGAFTAPNKQIVMDGSLPSPPPLPHTQPVVPR